MIERSLARSGGRRAAVIEVPGKSRPGSERNVLVRARIVAALLLCGGVGCGAHTQRMQVSIAADANGNAPVIFSIVLPRNKVVFKKLLDLTAKQWFSQREQLLRDYRTDLDEAYFEFVPGQRVPELAQKGRGNVGQGILFVGYHSAGANRYTFDTGHLLKVNFGQHSVTFTP